MKVGFATNDNILINDHFGWAKNFAIYEINMDGFKFLENRYFEDEAEELNKIDRKIEKLMDVKIIFTLTSLPTIFIKFKLYLRLILLVIIR